MAAKETKSIPATTLKLLGKKPAEFDMPVTLVQLDGEEVKFYMRVKALDAKEWAALRDDRQRAVLSAMKPADMTPNDGETPIDAAIRMIDKRGFAARTAETAERDAELVMKFAVSWPAEDPLTSESLVQLESEVPGSLETLIGSYDAARFHGRLGN